MHRSKVAWSLAVGIAWMAAAPTVAADESELAAFAKAVSGDWSRIAAPRLADFPPEAVAFSLAACRADNPNLLRFRKQGETLLRSAGPENATLVLQARRGEERQGFASWLVLTLDGAEGLLLGQRPVGDADRMLMLSDAGSYVRCPSAEPAPEDEKAREPAARD